MNGRAMYYAGTSLKRHIYRDCVGLQSAVRAGWNVLTMNEAEPEPYTPQQLCAICAEREAVEAARREPGGGRGE